MKNASRSGSTLVMALLLIAVIGAITAGGVAVLVARSGMVGEMETAAKRRIALENSKALAQAFMLERVMVAAQGDAFSYALPDPSWGGISVPDGWGAAPPLRSIDKVAGVNHFNPGNGDSYSRQMAIVVREGAEDADRADPTRRYQINSRSPFFAGTLLTIQAPTLSPAAVNAVGGLDINGGAFVWRPTLFMTFLPNFYAMPAGADVVTFMNSAGATLRMSNLALPRQIANPRMAGSFHTGEFDVVDNPLALPPTASADSSVAKITSGTYGTPIIVNGTTDDDAADGVTCDDEGNVTVTLADTNLRNVYITGNIATLALEGQAAQNDGDAAALPAILIVVEQPADSPRNLTAINLDRQNSRRLALAVKKAAPAGNVAIDFSTTSAAWRLVLELENMPVEVFAAGIVQMQGGIRTDRSVLLAAGGLTLTFESDPKLLERYASRTAWVESYGVPAAD